MTDTLPQDNVRLDLTDLQAETLLDLIDGEKADPGVVADIRRLLITAIGE